MNTGLVYAREQGFEYIGVLNPDAIADKNWCKALVDELSSQPKCGIATGILQRRDSKTLDTTGDFYTTWGLPGPRNRDEPVENAPSKPGEIFGATGGGAIYRAAIFDDIDMFDEDFFMYYEDVDLSFSRPVSWLEGPIHAQSHRLSQSRRQQQKSTWLSSLQHLQKPAISLH
ncbi:glycosyltransferase [Candidatus Minimicrobia naudis]